MTEVCYDNLLILTLFTVWLFPWCPMNIWYLNYNSFLLFSQHCNSIKRGQDRKKRCAFLCSESQKKRVNVGHECCQNAAHSLLCLCRQWWRTTAPTARPFSITVELIFKRCSSNSVRWPTSTKSHNTMQVHVPSSGKTCHERQKLQMSWQHSLEQTLLLFGGGRGSHCFQENRR